jgi:hypothetical protein
VSPPRSSVERDAAPARNSTSGVVLVGGLLVVAGIVISAISVPRTEVDTSYLGSGEVTHKGSAVGFFLGICASGVGSLIVTVALVAYGVSLGVRMSRQHE